MKKKSIAALALTGALSLSLLSGCGQTADAATPTQDSVADDTSTPGTSHTAAATATAVTIQRSTNPMSEHILFVGVLRLLASKPS